MPELLGLTRRTWRVLLVLATVGLAVWGGFYARSKRGYRAAGGIYIADGGQTCVVVRPGALGRLHVDAGAVNILPRRPRGVKAVLDVSFADGQLYVRQYENGPTDLSDSTRWGIALNFGGVLVPSSTTPGDWDLVGGSADVKVRQLGYSFDRMKDRIGRWIERTVKTATGRGSSYEVIDYSAGITPDQGRLPHFLHRVDDPRLVAYMADRRLAGAEGVSPMLLRDIAADHPNDPYIQLHHIEMEALHDNLETAEDLWAQWKPVFDKHPDPLLRDVSRRVWATLEAERFTRDCPGVAKYWEVCPSNASRLAGTSSSAVPWDLTRKIRWLGSLANCKRLQCLGAGVHPQDLATPGELPEVAGLWGDIYANFLECQTAVKAAEAIAVLRLFEGKRDQARELLFGAYWLGASMNADAQLINRLIGIALRRVALNGLEVLLLNACEREEETEPLLARFAEMRKADAVFTSEALLTAEFSPLMARMVQVGPSSGTPDFTEASCRQRAVNAAAAVFEAAAAAKLLHLRHGRYPGSAPDFDEVLAEGLPADPFLPDEKVRTREAEDGFLVYSVGPDEADDGGGLLYDTTNGTKSAGDVVLKIPNERRYPFPEGPVHAANADELLRTFPNGLPADLFASGTPLGRPALGIVDATSTRSLMVLSTGPDNLPTLRDSSPATGPLALQPIYRRTSPVLHAQPYGTPVPIEWDVQYDSTNGTNSAGSIFIELPR